MGKKKGKKRPSVSSKVRENNEDSSSVVQETPVDVEEAPLQAQETPVLVKETPVHIEEVHVQPDSADEGTSADPVLEPGASFHTAGKKLMFVAHGSL